MSSYPRDRITGLVLAGGRGSRMGGADKGLIRLAGRPMIEHVLQALTPQVHRVLISANRNPEAYGAFGCPVVPDAVGGHPGPLAGIAAGLAASGSDYLLTVPCDAPFLPADLAPRLYRALEDEGADVAYPATASGAQPVFSLLRAGLLPALEAHLAAGGRRVESWLAAQRHAVVDFSDLPEAFMNVNTAAELAQAERRLAEA